ncbi:MAG: hypothetical protein IJ515_00775 [Clostridia bacterium]|nr:hypothetical protein [Clostridia bacterium]
MATLLTDEIQKREYPSVLQTADGRPVAREEWAEHRQEMTELLERYSYGKTPRIPVRVWGESELISNDAYDGRVFRERVRLFFETERGKTSFPVEFFIPKGEEKPPVFLHIAFRPVPDKYIPVEKITAAGYALCVVVYTDMMNDDHFGDFSGGIAEHFGTDEKRGREEWGKIGMWAYGASRVLDYMIESRHDVDTARVAVIGHSRLGKTALWCAAQDERFAAAISNDSGYGGAASSRHGAGERITDFLRSGSWDWFCERFKDYTGDGEDRKPYDQSLLLALIAPRYLCVGSATLDRGADPKAEFLTTLNASRAWELLGGRGLVCPDRMPEAGERFYDGDVGYQLRGGVHFLDPADWDAYIEFLDRKFGRDSTV